MKQIKINRKPLKLEEYEFILGPEEGNEIKVYYKGKDITQYVTKLILWNGILKLLK